MSELHLNDVIVRPVVTEKTAAQGETGSVYTFEVDMRANKNAVREAIEAIFGVNVEQVRTSVMPAKMGRRLRKRFIRKSEWKKAVVTLAAGQTIDLFSA
jgi:large subunit ribosomal protein L23